MLFVISDAGQAWQVATLTAVIVGLPLSSLATDPPLVVDHSLGAESSHLVPQGSTTIRVEGGAQRGTTLFHSFDQFGVEFEQQVLFDNPTGIDRILSRVTGESPTRILGTLSINGSADFFLINPQGIFFGPEARLDVAGAFTASTADSLQVEGYEFSAISTPVPPLLNLSIQPGIQFGTNLGHRPIRNEAQLSVGPQQQLSLIGSRIEQVGTLLAPGGIVELQGNHLSLTGTVDTRNTSGTVGTLRLNTSGDLTIQPTGLLTNGAINQALLTNHVELQAEGNLTVQGALNSVVASSLTMTAGQDLRWLAGDGPSLLGGDLSLVSGRHLGLNSTTILNGPQNQTFEAFAAGNLTVTNAILSHQSGQQQAGFSSPSVSLQAGNLLLHNAAIEASTAGVEDGADIRVEVDNEVQLHNSHIVTLSSPGAQGRTGDITLQARHIRLDGSHPSQQSTIGAVTDNLSSSDAGTIRLTATESIELIGYQPGPFAITDLTAIELLELISRITGISSTAFGSGLSGDIIVNTDQLLLRDRVAIGILPGLGDNDINQTGDITIHARDTRLQGLALLGSITPNAVDAGNVTIQGDHLTLDQGAFIGTNAFPFLGNSPEQNGDAGTILIDVSDLNVFNGSLLFAGTDGGGQGGQIRVNADNVTLSGVNANGRLPSALRTSVGADAAFLDLGSATGAGGEIVVNTDNLRILDGGQIIASTNSLGAAGDITITADIVEVSGTHHTGIASTLEAQANGIGDAGTLRINADRLTIRDGAAISTQSRLGHGGDIKLAVSDVLLMRHQGRLSATAGLAGTTGNGGNIKISAGFIIAPGTENSDITANAFDGHGGIITLHTNGLLGIAFRHQLTPESDITVSSELGVHGLVEINTLELDPSHGLEILPESLAEASDEIRAGCFADEEDASFITSGQGGLPVDPREEVAGWVVVEDWREGEPPSAALRPAQGQWDRGDWPSVQIETASWSSSDEDMELHGVESLTEAQGWQRNGQGQIEFVTHVSTTDRGRWGSNPVSCDGISRFLKRGYRNRG